MELIFKRKRGRRRYTRQEWIERMLDRLEWSVNPATKCWEITSHVPEKRNGYVLLGRGRKSIRAHRFMWIVEHGSIPDGLLICHTCDNRKCVNPSHLYLGTRQDNIQDAVDRNRWRWGRARGQRKKLTDEQIKEIRESPLSSYKLAEIYPVSDVQIRRIRNGTRCENIK